MLKHIRTEQVILGMYVDSFDGSWFDHPFWRSGFLLTSDRDVAKIRDSGVDAVVIDTAKGVDVGEPDATAEQPLPEPASAEPSSVRSIRSSSSGSARSRITAPSCPPGEEKDYDQASQLVMRSKRAVKRMFGDIRLGKAVDGEKLAPLVDEITGSVVRNPYALLSIARLKNKDEYTYLHSVAVCALMINLARHLRIDESLIRDIGMAGLLHDVGKMAVPETLLQKPGALTESEFDVVKGHAERGYRLLKRSSGVPDIALDVCLHHHERVDGSGYPNGLKGENISLYARMSAICDVYDAITSTRAYKDAWDPAEALTRMSQWEGHFDQEIFATFIQSIGIYPVGTLVRLRSGLLAVVVEECRDDFTRPVVSSFFRVSDRRPTIVQTRRVDTFAERIVSSENPADWGFDDWDAQRDAILTQGQHAAHRAA